MIKYKIFKNVGSLYELVGCGLDELILVKASRLLCSVGQKTCDLVSLLLASVTDLLAKASDLKSETALRRWQGYLCCVR
jgi:hypothetical protein